MACIGGNDINLGKAIADPCSDESLRKCPGSEYEIGLMKRGDEKDKLRLKCIKSDLKTSQRIRLSQPVIELF